LGLQQEPSTDSQRGSSTSNTVDGKDERTKRKRKSQLLAVRRLPDFTGEPPDDPKKDAIEWQQSYLEEEEYVLDESRRSSYRSAHHFDRHQPANHISAIGVG